MEEVSDIWDYIPDWFSEFTQYWREYYPNAQFLQQKKQGARYQCYLALAPPMGDSKNPKRIT